MPGTLISVRPVQRPKLILSTISNEQGTQINVKPAPRPRLIPSTTFGSSGFPLDWEVTNDDAVKRAGYTDKREALAEAEAEADPIYYIKRAGYGEKKREVEAAQ